MHKLFISVALLALAGCATSPIPEGYSGPIATIRDSASSETANRAQFFFLSEIDGNPVKNVLGATRQANSGRGFSLNTVPFSRSVPAKQATFTIEGKIDYGAPIQAIINMGTVYSVQKKVTFAPQSNRTYIVKGTLTANRRDVWIEDDQGKRIE
ncbi:MAG TPA: hypothetical protein VED01_20620 [Burkholderiales bacterium]|nr:hypothetical protein [Burkholderiales bacterium]